MPEIRDLGGGGITSDMLDKLNTFDEQPGGGGLGDGGPMIPPGGAQFRQQDVGYRLYLTYIGKAAQARGVNAGPSLIRWQGLTDIEKSALGHTWEREFSHTPEERRAAEWDASKRSNKYKIWAAMTTAVDIETARQAYILYGTSPQAEFGTTILHWVTEAGEQAVQVVEGGIGVDLATLAIVAVIVFVGVAAL